jgi:hypothetical protein
VREKRDIRAMWRSQSLRKTLPNLLCYLTDPRVNRGLPIIPALKSLFSASFFQLFEVDGDIRWAVSQIQVPRSKQTAGFDRIIFIVGHMSSVTLVHPEETLTVPALQAMTKCSLFAKNPILTTSPYRVKSPVSLSIFRDFVGELEGNPMKITATNLKELQRLCDEFGFGEFSAKLSKFFDFSNCLERRQFANAFAGMRSVSLNESIEFIMNRRVIEMEISEAIALFPSVREQLSVDGCGRKFFVTLSGIEASDIRSLELLLSGESISVGGSEERLFLNCWKGNNQMNLSTLLKERRLDFESVDVSIVSIEALDGLLLNESVTVESEDALLRLILKLGSDYRDLLRHIQLEFLSEDGVSLLSEYLKIPPESLWECVAGRVSHPPFVRFLQSSAESGFRFCGVAVAMVSVLRNFTADVTVTQTISRLFWTRKGISSVVSLR